jgi:diguanylate cyclase (GGDEF)-like protein
MMAFLQTCKRPVVWDILTPPNKYDTMAIPSLGVLYRKEFLSMYPRDTTSQYNVLIVDDDPVILNLLTHLLEMGHYRVRSATEGNQALQMVLQDCPDILIADWFMPGLDGLELCRRIRQLHARKVLPHYSYVLILVMNSNKNSVIEVLEAGADDFIQKNVTSLADFRAEIQARLGAAQRIRKLEMGLEFAAKYDSLTRLLNRVAFFEAAQTLWDRSIRRKSPLAAVMMDCDLFKRVNDIHGHLAGDTVLRELAATLRDFSRSTDVICRYGGEEFCAILPGCTEEIAWDWADRIRQQCESIPFNHEGLDISTTVSFGIAERTEATALLDHLLDNADQSLLAAKEWGRNRCVSYSEILTDACGNGTCHFTQQLFDSITARDIMISFPLAIQQHDSVAVVADHFLKTRFETLPVTDHAGKLVGVISETNVIAVVGQVEQWVMPIKNFVNPNVATYPAETPVRKIVDFLNRTSVRRVMIVQDGILVGYICRTLLLRWLRNQWAAVSGRYNDIIPDTSSRKVLANNLRSAISALKRELTNVDGLAAEDEEVAIQDRERMVTMVSQCQDIMDQVLKYGSIPTVNDSDVLPSGI